MIYSQKMPKKETYKGPISVNTKGVGFFNIDENRENTLEIQPENLNRAFPGDTVEVEKLNQRIKNRDQGKVVKIIERFRDEFVGTVHNAYVIPDDKRVYVDIFIKEKIEEGTKVLVKIADWNTL